MDKDNQRSTYSEKFSNTLQLRYNKLLYITKGRMKLK